MSLVLVAYLVLAWVAGIALTLLSRMPWDLEGRLAAAVPVGFGAAAMLTWMAAIPLGMSAIPLVVSAIALLALTVAILRRDGRVARLRSELATALGRWRSREAVPLIILLGVSMLFFIPVYAGALQMGPDGLQGGIINLWGDWAWHLVKSGFLASTQHLLFPQNPQMAGTRMNYPFLPDFFSGMLTHLGVDLTAALPVSSALLSVAFPLVFYSTALRLTERASAALLGALVFLLGTGIGFTLVPGEVVPTSDDLGGWIAGVGNLLTAPPHLWYSLIPERNIQWFNPVLQLIPQRNTQFGWPLALIALSLLWHGWRAESRREMVLAGLVVGLLPFFYANFYMDFMVFSVGAAVLSVRKWKSWLWYFVPAGALGLSELVVLLPPQIAHATFFRIQLGWLAGAGGHSDNVVWFWFANTAFLIPLAIVSLVIGPGARPRLRRFLLAGWLLFLIPNLLILQPSEWDNLKWLMWWGMLASILAGSVLADLLRRGPILAGLAVLLFLAQTLSGTLDLGHVWLAQNTRPWQMVDSDGVALAAWIQDQTAADSVFLAGTTWNDSNPRLVLAGRPLVVGAPWSLWTTGLDPAPRLSDAGVMFRGNAGADELLRSYGVNYVLIGPGEIKDMGANQDYFRSHYSRVYESPTGEYQVFWVG